MRARSTASFVLLHVLLLLPPGLFPCAQLLKKQHLSDVLEVAEMRDGVVAFEAAADADRFASKLEEEGHSQVRRAQRSGCNGFAGTGCYVPMFAGRASGFYSTKVHSALQLQQPQHTHSRTTGKPAVQAYACLRLFTRR